MRNSRLYRGLLSLAIAGAGAGLISAAHAENTDRSKAEPACRSSSVIFCENWEDGDWIGWNDYNAGDSLNKGGYRGGQTCATGGCLLPYPGYNNSRAVALVLPKDQLDAIYPKGVFQEKINPNETLYARWRVYWSPGFHFNYNNTKNFYLITDAGSSGGTYRVAFQVRPKNGGDPTIAVPYFHLYDHQMEVAAGTWQADQARRNGGDVRYFSNQPGAEDLTLKGGRWYTIEIGVTPNPQGQKFGGRLQFWIDGKLLADYSDNVSIRKADDKDVFDGVWLSTYFGGAGQTTHPEQYVVYDDIIVSRSRIGTGELSPPKSPILRRVE